MCWLRWAELKKRDVPGVLTKATTNKKSPFNRNTIFQVYGVEFQKKVNKKNYYTYRVQHSDTKEKVLGRFKREELYKI